MQSGGTATSEVWKAAASGDMLLLGKLLRDDGASASALAESVDLRVHEHTALMTAAQNGHAGAVRLLCGVEGVDLRAATEMGRNAIHLATEAGHAEVVAFLAELKLAPRATTNPDTAAKETRTAEAIPPPDTANPEYSADGGTEDDELTRALSILPAPYAHAVTQKQTRARTHTAAHTRAHAQRCFLEQEQLPSHVNCLHVGHQQATKFYAKDAGNYAACSTSSCAAEVARCRTCSCG